MSSRKKKENTEQEPKSDISASITRMLANKDIESIVLVGIGSKGLLHIETTYETFAPVHGALNRAMFELNMAEINHVREMNKEVTIEA